MQQKRTVSPDVTTFSKSLRTRLIEQITLDGPLSVADYVHICLLDQQDGYYTRHVTLGADGDFITAPTISQMFGEMIGVWVAQVWHDLGSPARFHLVEIGGGDGSLMSDILRVARHVPGLTEAAAVVFVEPGRLGDDQIAHAPGATRITGLRQLTPEHPAICIANELLDCLPARQFVRMDDGWHERRIGVRDGELIFGLVPVGPDFIAPFEPPLGEIVEISFEQTYFAYQLAEYLKAATGAALLIDYGRDAPGTGDTLQALSRHEKRDPLEAPGRHDLTQWADFPAIAATARQAGVHVSPITQQGTFLHRMGIDARLVALSTKNPGHAPHLERQYQRLTAADQMGELFKVLGLAWPDTLNLPGLDAPPS